MESPSLDQFLTLFEGNRLEFLWAKYGEPRVQLWIADKFVGANAGGTPAQVDQKKQVFPPHYNKEVEDNARASVRARFDQCLRADPTSKVNGDPSQHSSEVEAAGGYSEWILRMWLQADKSRDPSNLNYGRFFEDLYKVREDLGIFRRIQARLPIEDRNIFNLKTPQELFQLINRFMVDNKVNKTKMQNLADVSVIHSDDKLFIGIPKTFEAARQLGNGTRWCTSGTSGEGYFSDYNSKGPLIIVILFAVSPNGEEHKEYKYQLHFETNQFMDSNDQAISLDGLLGLDKIKKGEQPSANPGYRTGGTPVLGVSFEQVKLREALRSYFTRELETNNGGLSQLIQISTPEELEKLKPMLTPDRLEALAQNTADFLSLIKGNLLTFEAAKPAFDANNNGNPPSFLESQFYLRVCFNDLESLAGFFGQGRNNGDRSYAEQVFKEMEGNGDSYDNTWDVDIQYCYQKLDKENMIRLKNLARDLCPGEEGDLEELLTDSPHMDEVRMAMERAEWDATRMAQEEAAQKAVFDGLGDIGLGDFQWHNIKEADGKNKEFPSFSVSIQDAIEAARWYHANYSEEAQMSDMLPEYLHHEGTQASVNTYKVDQAYADDKVFNEILVDHFAEVEADIERRAKPKVKRKRKSTVVREFLERV